MMRTFAISFLLGMCLINLFKFIDDFWIVTAFSLVIVFLILHIYWRKLSNKILFLIALGLTWILIASYYQLNQQLPASLENTPCYVQGYVTSLPADDGKAKRFLFKTTEINNISHSYLLKLDWFYPNSSNTTMDKAVDQHQLSAGEQWRLLVRLKRPHGFMNPGGFDYEKWMFSEHIDATGEVLNNGKNIFLKKDWYRAPFLIIRQHVLQRLISQFNDQPLANLIPALTVGYQQAINEDQWQVFRNTGTNHLLAIAGLHIGFIAGLIFLSAGFLWRLFPRLCLLMPRQQFAAMVSLVGAFGYSALAGFSLPTQRAMIILAVSLVALILKRKLMLWQGLSSALLIILFTDPLAILSTSFWLSFIAVSMIIYGIGNRIKPHGWWWKWGRTQWVVACGLFPISVWYFQQASFSSLLANFIAIPWIGFIVLPLSLSACLLLFINHWAAHLFLGLAIKNLQFLWPILVFLSKQSVSAWQYVIPSHIILGFTTIAILLVLAPRGLPGRYLIPVFLLPFFKPYSFNLQQGEVLFTLLDVGQGLSAVILTANHALIYDTGAKFTDNFDAGSAVIVPFLKFMRISHVDMMMISHGDNDHIGGAASILQNLKVASIYTSIPQRFPAGKANYCIEGQHWQWDQVNFQVLYPQAGNDYLDNDSSCVLKISTGKQAVLLTGDIEKNSEQYLVAHEKNNLSSIILVAPHHGSKTSSTMPFIQAVSPHFVLFPIGYLNRYHFPDAVILQNYASIGAIMFNTATAGAISFLLDGHSELQPILYRFLNHHIWNA